MSCCICNRAGHDEELHGDEGVEILELRERVSDLERALGACERHVQAAIDGVVGPGKALTRIASVISATQAPGADRKVDE